MTSEVSIVIPTFNRAHLVAKTIESALAQTYPCEVIVCDHGSTDNTPEVMKQYEGKVAYIRREEDFGPHFCWLDGVLHAHGEFIHIEFDDDWLEPAFIEKTIALMDDDVGMVFSGIRYISQDGLDTPVRFDQAGDLFRPQTGKYNRRILEKSLLKGLMLSPAACLFRKQDVLDALYQGRLPTNWEHVYHGVGPDHFMSFMAVMHYPKFGYCAEHLTVFRSHASGITIASHGDQEKTRRLNMAYCEVKVFYQLLKFYHSHFFFRMYIRRVALWHQAKVLIKKFLKR